MNKRNHVDEMGTAFYNQVHTLGHRIALRVFEVTGDRDLATEIHDMTLPVEGSITSSRMDFLKGEKEEDLRSDLIKVIEAHLG